MLYLKQRAKLKVEKQNNKNQIITEKAMKKTEKDSSSFSIHEKLSLGAAWLPVHPTFSVGVSFWQSMSRIRLNDVITVVGAASLAPESLASVIPDSRSCSWDL